MMTRRDKILSSINTKGVGLEIGPSFSPIAPKSEGYNVRILDWMSTQELITLNKSRNHDVSKIEPVDYVWSGGSLKDLIGESACFDWVIASHVIEHTPDLIGFINGCAEILKDDGVLSLAVPDKRYCFDHFRPVSSLSQVIDRSLCSSFQHSPGSVVEYFLYCCWKGGVLAWERGYPGEYEFPYDLDFVKRMYDQSRNSSKYIDIHAWCFTPSSFRLMMVELATLGMIVLKECAFFDTAGYEFFVSMDRRGSSSIPSRTALMKRVLDEAAI